MKNLLTFLIFANFNAIAGLAGGVWIEIGDAPSFPDGQAQVTRGAGDLIELIGTTTATDFRDAYCITQIPI